ncbi:MAG TPA: hypothetical protein V6C63_17325 [Allocoleopsis sp.]
MPSESFEQQTIQQIGDNYKRAELKLQNAIALLQEQLESLKQELAAKDQQIQVIEQELVQGHKSELFEQQTLQQISDDYERTELKLQDAIALLQEQLESLKQELAEQNWDAQILERELAHTYQDLVELNQENQQLSVNKQLSLSQAKILSQVLLDREKLKPETLAELLSAIYGTQVKPEEFDQTVASKIQGADC